MQPDVIVRFPNTGTGSRGLEAIILIDEGYSSYVCGLCGIYNGDPSDDTNDWYDCPDDVWESPNILEYRKIQHMMKVVVIWKLTSK